ncbi:MAG: serine/threonine-protein phosphatase, partial [Firmicutes bacterium]|nr:serine/threonine-protein phosphatase [Bacillota bacterium]
MFVTAWMGILNTRTGVVTFANAGHNPPLVKHENSDFEYLKVRPGFVLAGMEGIQYKKNELQLEPGDVIFLYTDGVTEATNANNELYGEDRLRAVLNAHKDADTDTLCRMVQEDVDRFVGEAPQFDDITMVCLRYNGEGA